MPPRKNKDAAAATVAAPAADGAEAENGTPSGKGKEKEKNKEKDEEGISIEVGPSHFSSTVKPSWTDHHSICCLCILWYLGISNLTRRVVAPTKGPGQSLWYCNMILPCFA